MSRSNQFSSKISGYLFNIITSTPFFVIITAIIAFIFGRFIAFMPEWRLIVLIISLSVCLFGGLYIWQKWGAFGILCFYAATFWIPVPFIYQMGGFTTPLNIFGVFTFVFVLLFILRHSVINSFTNVYEVITLGLLVIGSIVSFFYGVAPITSEISGVMGMVIYPIIFYLFSKTVVHSSDDVIKLIRWFAIGSVAMILVLFVAPEIGLYTMQSGPVTSRLGGAYMIFGESFFAGFYATGVAAWCSILLPLVFCMAIYEKYRKIQFKILAILIAVALLLTGGRAGFSAAIISLLVVVILAVNFRELKFNRLSVIFVVVVLVLVIAGFVAKQHGSMELLGDRYRYSEISRIDFSWRMKMTQIAWGVSKEHPLGLGFNSFPLFADGFYPHNTWIVSAVYVGWIGFIGLVGFIIFLIYKYFSKLKKTKSKVLIIGAIGTTLAVIINGFFEELFAYYYVWCPIWIIWGVTINIITNKINR